MKPKPSETSPHKTQTETDEPGAVAKSLGCLPVMHKTLERIPIGIALDAWCTCNPAFGRVSQKDLATEMSLRPAWATRDPVTKKQQTHTQAQINTKPLPSL